MDEGNIYEILSFVFLKARAHGEQASDMLVLQPGLY